MLVAIRIWVLMSLVESVALVIAGGGTYIRAVALGEGGLSTPYAIPQRVR